MNVNELIPEVEDFRQVKIVIGNDGKNYYQTDPHFEVSGVEHAGLTGQVILLMPETVAEFFRQQGRRELQGELRKLINAGRG